MQSSSISSACLNTAGFAKRNLMGVARLQTTLDRFVDKFCTTVLCNSFVFSQMLMLVYLQIKNVHLLGILSRVHVSEKACSRASREE